MAPVASTTAIPASRLHGPPDRPSMVSVGTVVWLSSELMFFAALFAAYLTVRGLARGCYFLGALLRGYVNDRGAGEAAVGAGDGQAQPAVRDGQHHRPG